MQTRRCGPGQPPWWPHNEPWPPRRRVHDGSVRRGHFFWRLAAVALAVLLLAACGVLALAWLAATGLGIGAVSPAGVAVLLVGGGTFAVVAAAFALSRVMRRVAMPLGAVMDAADRVAGGDYSVRVGEHGPPPIRALGRAFNTMTGRLEDHDRLRRD